MGIRYAQPQLEINLGDVRLEGTSYRLESSVFWWAPWSLALLSVLSGRGSLLGRWRRDQLLPLCDKVAAATYRALGESWLPGAHREDRGNLVLSVRATRAGTSGWGIERFRVGLRKQVRSIMKSEPSRIERIYAMHPLRAETILAQWDFLSRGCGSSLKRPSGIG